MSPARRAFRHRRLPWPFPAEASHEKAAAGKRVTRRHPQEGEGNAEARRRGGAEPFPSGEGAHDAATHAR